MKTLKIKSITTGQSENFEFDQNLWIKSFGISAWTDAGTHLVDYPKAFESIKLSAGSVVKQMWSGGVRRYSSNPNKYACLAHMAANCWATLFRVAYVPLDACMLYFIAPPTSKVLTIAASNKSILGEQNDIQIHYKILYKDFEPRQDQPLYEIHVNSMEHIEDLDVENNSDREIKISAVPEGDKPHTLLIAVDKWNINDEVWEAYQAEFGNMVLKAGGNPICEMSLPVSQIEANSVYNIPWNLWSLYPGITAFKLPIGEYPTVPWSEDFKLKAKDFASLKLYLSQKRIENTKIRITTWLISARRWDEE